MVTCIRPEQDQVDQHPNMTGEGAHETHNPSRGTSTLVVWPLERQLCSKERPLPTLMHRQYKLDSLGYLKARKGAEVMVC